MPQLGSLREFGTLIRKQLVHCSHAGALPVVLLVAVDTLAAPPVRADQLAAVGMRLRSRVRATDLVVQIGDRFGVFLQGDAGRHAPSIRERLRLALLDDFTLAGSYSHIRPRFGMAIHPGTPISGIELVGQAERALEDCAPLVRDTIAG
ncbi:MAG: hypothetical protein JO369_08845 [Paucibacter sp.]|nr:hypothetical protein [Roseateles sp.]